MTKNPVKQKIIEAPEGIQISLDESVLKITGTKGELSREFYHPLVSLILENNKITISPLKSNKMTKALLGTFEAHILNMFKGVLEGYTYKLKIVYSHFPITVKQVENRIELHNFLGEKVPRIAKVVGTVKFDIGKDEVIIEGIDKEAVSQTAANMELATKVRRRDLRVFQDGAYITQRG